MIYYVIIYKKNDHFIILDFLPTYKKNVKDISSEKCSVFGIEEKELEAFHRYVERI